MSGTKCTQNDAATITLCSHGWLYQFHFLYILFQYARGHKIWKNSSVNSSLRMVSTIHSSSLTNTSSEYVVYDVDDLIKFPVIQHYCQEIWSENTLGKPQFNNFSLSTGNQLFTNTSNSSLLASSLNSHSFELSVYDADYLTEIQVILLVLSISPHSTPPLLRAHLSSLSLYPDTHHETHSQHKTGLGHSNTVDLYWNTTKKINYNTICKATTTEFVDGGMKINWERALAFSIFYLHLLWWTLYYLLLLIIVLKCLNYVLKWFKQILRKYFRTRLQLRNMTYEIVYPSHRVRCVYSIYACHPSSDLRVKSPDQSHTKTFVSTQKSQTVDDKRTNSSIRQPESEHIIKVDEVQSEFGFSPVGTRMLEMLHHDVQIIIPCLQEQQQVLLTRLAQMVGMNIVTSYRWRIQDFPEEGAQTPRGGGGAPTYDFAKFFQKLLEIERIGTGGGVPRAPLDPPLHTVATLKFNKINWYQTF